MGKIKVKTFRTFLRFYSDRVTNYTWLSGSRTFKISSQNCAGIKQKSYKNNIIQKLLTLEKAKLNTKIKEAEI